MIADICVLAIGLAVARELNTLLE